MVRALALLLTALTGFSGLVYEIAWQRYLATLLGSHSEATSAVLGIFLGGLSVGYWLFGVVTRRVVERAEAAGRPPRLLLVYGFVEAGIGLYVILFPWLFRGVQGLSYALPHGAGGLGFAIDVGLSTLLIGPASVLMGGTIPMLTQALARSLADATRFHAFVYAFNTFGAFVGALAAGFYLVPKLGLENVMLSMGCINLLAGAMFLAVGARGREVVALDQEAVGQVDQGDAARLNGFAFYAAIALLTGFALMAIQTTVIRVAALSLGSSQFTFSMVVAVFVLSIALGSFLVSAFSRISPMVIVCNQWGVAFLFLLLYPWLDESPYWAMLVRSVFQDTNGGFVGFHFLALLLILVVIGPPVILSGAALPLLFHHMRRQVAHLGDLAGSLYSWNTVGSLLGALLGGYALLFWLDLHHVYRLSLIALLCAAGILTVRVYGRVAVVSGALAMLVCGVLLLPAWRPELLYSGLFRKGVYLPRVDAHAGDLLVGADRFVMPYGGQFAPKILFHTDDPTASVVVREHENPGGIRSRSIATQGKNDGDTHLDYGTTGLLAVLPALLAEKAERAFVVGWGVGTTAGELGTFESMREVLVAEISPGVMDAAPLFDFATHSASTNPKIRVIQSDAYRALMRSTGTFDVIASEPSHVWSAGVEMLFTREFLEAARSRLSPGGVYCQFIHRYEIDAASISMVLRTFASVYDDASVWQDDNQTLLLLGFNDPKFATDEARLAQRAARPDFKATLERSGIPSFSLLLAHELLPVGAINATELPGPIHSLYHPLLNDLAGRAFFRSDPKALAGLPFTGYGEPARVGARNSLLRRHVQRLGGRLPDVERADVIAATCRFLRALCNPLMAQWMSERRSHGRDGPAASELFEKILDHVVQTPRGLSRDRLEEMSRLFGSLSRPSRSRATAAEAQRASQDFFDYYHHAAPFDPGALLATWSSCREGASSEAACRAAAQAHVGADPVVVDFEGRVRDCMSRARTGPACQTGAGEARALVEQGKPSKRRGGERTRAASGTRPAQGT
jgi:spermidine synthase